MEWEHRSGTQNAVADVLSRNPVESIIGEKVNLAVIWDLVLSSRKQLIEQQRKDTGLGHIYRYLENPEDSSVNATICQKLITPFQKLVMVSFGTEFPVGDDEILFHEAKRNTKAKHENWEKYYNRRRKCDEMEIRNSSLDSNSSRPKSSSFESVQRRYQMSRSMVGRRRHV
ncbi:uncharacterized protein TNCV_3828351 [Trichonephila clavipes]|nr:uncharacterized protein TNCV_3828351 [Trichonephila clavipes]